MNPPAVRIGLAVPQEARSLARIHQESLPSDFLPSLGVEFLASVYYPAALRSGHAATLVAWEDDLPLGFVTVAWESRAFARDVALEEGGRLGVRAIRVALRRPAFLWECAQVFWAGLVVRPDPVQAEIVYIAVDGSRRGCGIGKQLVFEAMDCLRERGVSACRTKTLAKNASVIGMYESMGWRVRNRFRLLGREYVNLVVGA